MPFGAQAASQSTPFEVPCRQIAYKVKNLARKAPISTNMLQVLSFFFFLRMSSQSWVQEIGYSAWKLAKKLILQTLKRLPCEGVCTCASLRLELAGDGGTTAEESTIRKLSSPNTSTGFQRDRKLQICSICSYTSPSKTVPMHGCVLTLPSRYLMDRLYFSRQSQMHMWRLKSEGLSSNLGGQNMFSKQGTLELSIALWAGISASGFAAVSYAKK